MSSSLLSPGLLNPASLETEGKRVSVYSSGDIPGGISSACTISSSSQVLRASALFLSGELSLA